MNVVTRGVRNAFRNVTRTISIVTILGLSIGLSLIMLIAHQAVDEKIKTTLSSIGNTITIKPAGFVGGSEANNALKATQLAKVQSAEHVTRLTEILSDHVQTIGTTSDPAPPAGGGGGGHVGGEAPSPKATTDLKSTIVLNSDGSANGDATSIINGNGTGPRPALPSNFSLPIAIVGSNHPTDPVVIGASSMKITSGKPIDGDKDVNDAMISKAMAAKNNLKVGSTFTAYKETFTVAAIFDSGTITGDGSVIVSLPAIQRLSGLKGIVTSAVATADSLKNLSTVTDAVKKTLGSSADITSNVDQANQALAPLNTVKNISLYSLIGAVVAGAIIILLTMIMIVRERRREIGILKAIGGSNMRIMLQFMSEALAFTLLAAVIGLGVGILGGEPITSTLVSNSANPSNTSQTPGSASLQTFVSPTLNNVKDIQPQIDWTIVLYGIGTAVLIALIGSALASYFISRVKPAEVLRSE